MKKKLYIIISLIILSILLFTSLVQGSIDITVKELFEGILGIDISNNYEIVRDLRMPRVFIAVLIGIFLVNRTVSGENLNAFGIFCGIMSAIMYSFIVILNKKSKKVQGLENATIQLLMSFLTVAISGYLEPLSAIILATLILGETMRPLQMIGAVLIIGGAVFGEYYNSHL